MSDAYRVATDALIEASKVSGGSAYVAGMDDALCSNQAFVVVTALRDAGYLIEGGEHETQFMNRGWETDERYKATHQRDVISGPWRPVEEESNE